MRVEIAYVFTALLAALVGAVLGAVVTWQITQGARRTERAEAARRADLGTAQARELLATARAELAAARHDAQRREQDAAAATERARAAEAGAARLDAALTAERASARQAQDQLRESFTALSAEALTRNNEAFVQLAEARIKEATAALSTRAEGDATQRQQAIAAMLEPVSQTLHRLDGQLRSTEKDRESAYAGLREQVSTMHRTSQLLQSETKQLVNALRAPQVRGRWGELQLERVVQLAGMVEHCDFDRQVVAEGPNGGVRPDLVIRLAGGKQLVVDAKVPFAAYLEAVEATDEQTRAQRLAAHARQLKAHVDALSAKAYWAAFEPTPEFVVLFVPGDPFLEAALQADPALMEHAFEHNVVIATPTTLIALLRTVAYTWRQEALARNAAAVHALGKELHSRLATMGGHVSRLGKQLTGAVESYNRTVSSLESRVLVAARRFTDLKLVDGELDSPDVVEKTPRMVAAPELVASAADALIPLELPGQYDSSPAHNTGTTVRRSTVNG